MDSVLDELDALAEECSADSQAAQIGRASCSCRICSEHLTLQIGRRNMEVNDCCTLLLRKDEDTVCKECFADYFLTTSLHSKFSTYGAARGGPCLTAEPEEVRLQVMVRFRPGHTMCVLVRAGDTADQLTQSFAHAYGLPTRSTAMRHLLLSTFCQRRANAGIDASGGKTTGFSESGVFLFDRGAALRGGMQSPARVARPTTLESLLRTRSKLTECIGILRGLQDRLVGRDLLQVGDPVGPRLQVSVRGSALAEARTGDSDEHAETRVAQIGTAAADEGCPSDGCQCFAYMETVMRVLVQSKEAQGTDAAHIELVSKQLEVFGHLKAVVAARLRPDPELTEAETAEAGKEQNARLKFDARVDDDEVLLRLFEKFDTDKNGLIELQELQR